MEEFSLLANEFFNEIIRREPIWGTWLGLHEYDPLLPDPSKKSELEKIEMLKEYRRRFEKVDAEVFEDRIDRELALYFIDNELFGREKLQFWRKYPRAPSELGDSLFLLFQRETRPLEERFNAIKSRLEKALDYLEKSKERIEEPVKPYVEIAIEEVSGLPSLIASLERTYKAKCLGELREAEEVIKAIKDYREWLEREVLPKSSERYYIGREAFEELLRVRRINISIDDIVKLGERGAEDERERARKLAIEIIGNENYLEALNLVKSHHPKSYSEVKEYVSKLLKEAKEFIKARDFATLPDREEVKIVETPEYLRHTIPFAAYIPPAPFDEYKLGLYMITPSEREEMLKEACYSCLANTLVHEAYPGHHLQLTCMFSKIRPIRLLCQPTESIEGWAFYCEEEMKRLGFYADAEGKLVQAIDALWRAVRVILDVKLSIGEIAIEDAVKLLTSETGMSEEAARAEVKRYIIAPGYPMSYYLGKVMIKQLKDKARSMLKGRYSDRWFHDLILYKGSVPLPMFFDIIERM